MLLSLVSLAASAPVIVHQDQNQFQPQLYGGFQPVERSDQDGLGTSSGGSYGSDFGGNYGGGDYSGGGTGGEYGGSYGGGGDFGGGHSGGLEGSSGGHLEAGGDHLSSDYSSLGGGYEGGDESGVSLDGGHSVVHSVPVSEHVEVTKPVPVKVIKHIGTIFFFKNLYCQRLPAIYLYVYFVV